MTDERSTNRSSRFFDSDYSKFNHFHKVKGKLKSERENIYEETRLLATQLFDAREWEYSC